MMNRFAAGVFCTLLFSRGAVAGEDPAMARVSTGSLRGVVTPDAIVFKGIPYAAPPIGDLRWRAPQPAPSWTGIREAGDYGASCEQSPSPAPMIVAGSRGATVSEDCLTLNVWTPAVRTSPVPVMVWLHGGGNLVGSGAQQVSEGAAFARDGVIIVTVNFRLGLFGFFAHPALAEGPNEPGGGNFGLLDQIAALHWVKSNIAAFGGDPENVTLFGESSGARDVVLLATSSAARGLFARAISESASPIWTRLPTLAQAAERGANIGADLGVPPRDATAARLRAIPADALVAAGNRGPIGPIGGVDAITGPASADFEGAPLVPIVVGTNEDDGGIIGGWSDPYELLQLFSNDELASLRARYRTRGISSDDAVKRQLFGDIRFAAPARWVAARSTAAGMPAYLYRFSYVGSASARKGVSSAPHASELQYVFETFGDDALDDSDRAVETTIHGCWVAFAKTGVPTCPGAPPWTSFDPKTGRQMVFDAHPSMRDPDDAGVFDVLQKKLRPT